MAKKEKEIKEKKEPGVLETALVSSREAKQLKYFPYACPIKIDDEDILIREIEKEIEIIKSMREERDLPDKWQEARDQYQGVVEFKDFPWENSSNLHIHITSAAVDIMKVKAKAQMFTEPMMLLKPLPSQIGENLFEDIALKEKFLNCEARDDIQIEDKLDPDLQDAINIGTGIAKLRYERDIDFDAVVPEIYEATPQDIARFKSDFKKDKGSQVYKDYLSDLEKGLSVEVWMKSDEIIYEGPKISYVKLEDLFVRPDIDDIRKHRVIAEKLHYTWMDLINEVEGNSFDRQVVMELKDKFPTDYYKKIYDGWEVICYYDYEKTNNLQRIKIVYLEEQKRILKALTFPFIHRMPDYVFYYIKKVPGSIYGEGLAEKLKDTNKAINDLWNQTVDSGTLRNAPCFKAVKGSEFDSTQKKWGPAAIWWVKTIADVEQFRITGGGAEQINYISRLERYAEWISGVSAYMTGRESPLDPNAPASKAYMLLKESNLRINDGIRQLHSSNRILFYQIDKLLFQYMRGNKLPFTVTKGEVLETKEITKKVLGIKVRYIPHLSDITVNKELEKEQDMKFALYLQSRAIVQSVPTAERTILEILIRNQGGVWEKMLDKLLPPEQKKLPQAGGASNIDKILQGLRTRTELGTPALPTAGLQTGIPQGIPTEEIPT